MEMELNPSGYSRLSDQQLQTLKDIATKLRIHSIKATDAANSGHPTSCASMAEIMSVLFFSVMRFDPKDVRNPASDRFVLSKGHAAPVLYAAFAEAGTIPVEDLVTLRKIDSELEGHPTPRQSYIDVATGSLGQGLGMACGMAYNGKYIDKSSYRVYCVIGDGENAEGSIWEAAAFASHYKLDNLVAIVDVNRLGQSEPTALQHKVDVYKARYESFGFNTIVLSGHDVEELCRGFYIASTVKDKPTCIIAKTLKGNDFPANIQDMEGWHGKPLGQFSAATLQDLEKKLSNPGPHGVAPRPFPNDCPSVVFPQVKLEPGPDYKLGTKIATRVAYGTALVKIGNSFPRIYALDGDTKNSTYSLTYKNAFPDRYIECFIAEQNLVGVAIGLATRNRNICFVSTFACFLSRAYDQVRMGAISQTQINLVGSHAGISIGEDGPSQMALEDFALFRAVPGAACFYPSDAVSCERAIELAANYKGITFTRTSRPATAVLYSNDEVFEIGKGKVVASSESDKVTVVGAGVTLHEAIKAAETLKAEGINIRIVDPFTLKPVDKELLVKSARATGGRVITVEDHFPEGGLGEAVAGALSEERDVCLRRLAVREVPRSGPGAVLLEMFGIGAGAIVKAVKEMIA